MFEPRNQNDNIAKIKRLSSKQAIINFSDFDIRIFIKYKGPYCSEIRIWKLPPKSNFLSMFNTKNLLWAIYNQDAKFLHGWFSEEGNLLEAITNNVAKCKNFDELKNLLIQFEKIIKGEIPSF